MNRLKSVIKEKENKMFLTKLYSHAILACALLHLIYCIFFYSQNIMPLAIYNFFSAMFFIIIRTYISINRMLKLSVAITIEILFYTLLQSLIIGFDIGVLIFPICVIQSYFYTEYIFESKKNCSYSFTALALIEYTVILLAINFFSFPLVQVNKAAFSLISILNIITALIFLTIITYLFLETIKSNNAQLIKSNNELSELANIDSLTHLLNRRCIKQKLENAIEEKKSRGKNFAVAICDIDNFKSFNDMYGHECGDMVLKKVADILKTTVRETDYVCRWGGEEMLILFMESDIKKAQAVTCRIHESIKKLNIVYRKERVSVTVTIGISSSENHNMIEEMIEEADAQMYYGKSKGKDCVIMKNEVVCI